MPSPASCMDFKQEYRRLFIGMDNGGITEFEVADDYNKITAIRNFVAHSGRVTQVIFSNDNLQWLLSVAKDKAFLVHETETGRRAAGVCCSRSLYFLAIRCPVQDCFCWRSKWADSYAQTRRKYLSSHDHFKGTHEWHQILHWDSKKQMLFSGGYDHTVVCWDIGGKRGTTYELQGHK